MGLSEVSSIAIIYRLGGHIDREDSWVVTMAGDMFLGVRVKNVDLLPLCSFYMFSFYFSSSARVSGGPDGGADVEAGGV